MGDRDMPDRSVVDRVLQRSRTVNSPGQHNTVEREGKGQTGGHTRSSLRDLAQDTEGRSWELLPQRQRGASACVQTVHTRL